MFTSVFAGEWCGMELYSLFDDIAELIWHSSDAVSTVW